MSAYAPLELFGFAALGELPFPRGFGQPHQFLLQALQHGGDVVDRLLHLLVIALVGLRDQLVDLAVGDLRQDAVAFADRQQDRIQHGIHATDDVGIRAAELVRFAALGKLSIPRGIRQAHQFLLQALYYNAHVVDGLLHLLVIAFVGLRDRLVDFTVGDLVQDAVAFADGQQNRIQHGVDTTHDVGIRAAELVRFAALGELSIPRSIGQAHQFLLQALYYGAHVVDGLLHLLVIAFVRLGDQLVDFTVGDLVQDAVALPDR